MALPAEPRPKAALARRQGHALALLVPTHPVLDPVLAARAAAQRRVAQLRSAIADQSAALGKLAEARAMLQLILHHILHMQAYKADVVARRRKRSVSVDEPASTRKDAAKLARARSAFALSPIPTPYRVRYLRKAWAGAAHTLDAAVDLSAFLSKSLQLAGDAFLVPDIYGKSRVTFSLMDLPGGLSLLTRAEKLTRMAREAEAALSLVEEWQCKQSEFLELARRDLERTRALSEAQGNTLTDLRLRLLLSEFGTPSEL